MVLQEEQLGFERQLNNKPLGSSFFSFLWLGSWCGRGRGQFLEDLALVPAVWSFASHSASGPSGLCDASRPATICRGRCESVTWATHLSRFRRPTGDRPRPAQSAFRISWWGGGTTSSVVSAACDKLAEEGRVSRIWSRLDGWVLGTFCFDRQKSWHFKYLNSERFRTNYQQSCFQFHTRSPISVKFLE